MARRYHDVRQELVDAIVSGEYGEGTWLPSEPQLSERFGASRGVLREALRGLEDRGLLAARAGRGHVVCQREEWDIRSADVLRAAIARGPEPGLLADAVAARAVVERAAAEMAAAAATAADLDLLAARVADMDEALAPGVLRTFGADDPLVDAEIWFHRTLGALGGNAVLAKLVEPLHAPLAELRRVRAPDRDRAVVRRHQAILEGVSSREPPLAAGAVSSYARSLARWLGAGR